MANSGSLPLLIKGYNSDINGGNSTIGAITSATQWNNVFDSGRGDVEYIDAIETGRPQFYVADTGNVATISVSGVQVIVNANSGDFAPYANPGNYYITPLKQPGGQTLQLSLLGVAGTTHGLQVLAFYQNQYDTAETRQKLYVSKLKRRYQDSYYSVIVNAKNQTSSTFTVPVGNGYVVGVEILAYIQTGSGTSDVASAAFTMQVNGIVIFENVCAVYGHASSTRPQIFPIRINPGDTFSFNTDASACSAGVNLGLGARLYFDDSNE